MKGPTDAAGEKNDLSHQNFIQKSQRGLAQEWWRGSAARGRRL